MRLNSIKLLRNISGSTIKYIVVILVIFLFTETISATVITDTTAISTQEMAIDYMKSVGLLQQSTYWPNVKPNRFINNINNNILHPLSIYEGAGTDFCSYAAFSYLALHGNPLGYAKFMVGIYINGTAQFGKVYFNPSKEVKQAAGLLKFHGRLDICPADQIWFLTLADEFKGFLNMYDRNYYPGGESNLWASTNYAKFNRMARRILNYKVDAKGSDIIRPIIPDIYSYLSERLKTGIVVLFVNNTFLYKKNHTLLKLGLPTHYIILQELIKTEDLLTITYWDYGCKTRRQMTTKFLCKILFGVSHCTIKIYDKK